MLFWLGDTTLWYYSFHTINACDITIQTVTYFNLNTESIAWSKIWTTNHFPQSVIFSPFKIIGFISFDFSLCVYLIFSLQLWNCLTFFISDSFISPYYNILVLLRSRIYCLSRCVEQFSWNVFLHILLTCSFEHFSFVFTETKIMYDHDTLHLMCYVSYHIILPL